MITVISATNRLNSRSALVAKFYVNKLQEQELAAQHYPLAQLPADFITNEMYGSRSEQFEAEIEQFVRSAEKVIFIVPEYNGGFPGILKTFIDGVAPHDWYGKKVALCGVSSGHTGCQLGMAHLTDVLHYLRMEVMALRPKLSGIENLLDESGALQDADCATRIEAQLEQFLKF